MKQLTLAFLVTETEICLALKKRGFGEGYWNGFGGKVESGETHNQAACREILEESGVQVAEKDLEKVAVLQFIYIEEEELEVQVFFVNNWIGEPAETQEMKPAWFAISEIPYEKMWADDLYWLPRILAGEKLTGKVWFGGSGKDIIKIEFTNW